MSGATITAFTPAYSQAYNSLCGQRCRDVERTVVDKESMDCINEMLGIRQEEPTFPMRYEFQKHNVKLSARSMKLFIVGGGDSL